MTQETFSYEEMTTRNFGFVDAAEQQKLRNSSVFIPGVGGMGGAVFMALLRAGIGRFTIADLDGFEVSNLNRQLFANMDSVGVHKAKAAAREAKGINPGVEIAVLGGEWTEQLEEIVPNHDILVNGMDDAAAGVHLYRCAAKHRRTLIDAYASPLPSVTVVGPDDPRLEERLGYPTVGVDWKDVTDDMRNECLVREIEYVLTHSSSHKHVDLDVAADVAAGRRSRFSFSTMVTLAGTMMAQEAVHHLLGRNSGTDYRGYFFNPHEVRVERPLPWLLAAPKAILVRRFLKKMMAQ
ncbi:ThiF family protein [Parasphingorhabdus marina DSM 22363]|uniref:ThiF family protein n=1 Tax=Parasphingorhabdus marina DSM 22363 TaxID=1123272 RepID=A0A1N6CMN9_9SPHN|nr:ThiF family adenylyltransferase [Parasphingorhabdus marina]SIN59725.1 ThiF family protein [Parasphingorhabdus marina DSM 22363]